MFRYPLSDHRAILLRDLSLAAAGWRWGISVTSQVSLGSDIIHARANCDGAAAG
jgi:hypothetical protein